MHKETALSAKPCGSAYFEASYLKKAINLRGQLCLGFFEGKSDPLRSKYQRIGQVCFVILIDEDESGNFKSLDILN
jgi:hypothetical protein